MFGLLAYRQRTQNAILQCLQIYNVKYMFGLPAYKKNVQRMEWPVMSPDF